MTNFDPAIHKRAAKMNEHVGLSPDESNRRAIELVQAAGVSEEWKELAGHLEQLRQNMQPRPAALEDPAAA